MKDFSLGLYEKSMPNHLSIQDKLIVAREAGYDYLELSIDETDEKLARLDWDRRKKKELKDFLFNAQMPIYTICLSGHRKYPLGSESDIVRQRALEIMLKAIDFASDIGIRIIQVAGYDVYYEPGSEKTKAYFIDNLRKSVWYAAKKGVSLAFETMETEFIDTVEKAMNYVRLIKSPYLQVYPDIGNITNAALQYSTDVLEDLQKAKGHISALHLKESLPGIYREVPFGNGHVKFLDAIQYAYNLGVRIFTAEFWHKENTDYKQEILRVRRLFEEIMKGLR